MRARELVCQSSAMTRSRSVALVDAGIQAAGWLAAVGILLVALALTIRGGEDGVSDRAKGAIGRAAAPAAESATPTAVATVYLVFGSDEAVQAGHLLVQGRRGAVETTMVPARDEHAFLTLRSLLLSDVTCPPASCGPVLVLDLRNF
jgi:hypothetical protein